MSAAWNRDGTIRLHPSVERELDDELDFSDDTPEPMPARCGSVVSSRGGGESPLYLGRSSYLESVSPLPSMPSPLGRTLVTPVPALPNGNASPCAANAPKRSTDLMTMTPPVPEFATTHRVGGQGEPALSTAERDKCRRYCNQIRKEQEARRDHLGFKDRLSDARVLYSMTELWDTAMAHYAHYYRSINRQFLLAMDREYRPIPILSMRIQPRDGQIVMRRDVRVIMSKGMCRVEKQRTTHYNSLISFKSNDLLAMYAKVIVRRALILLFITRYEGPVVFFFSESQILRVIMVLMQTKFVEILHSAVPENATGRYAMEIFRFCESQNENGLPDRTSIINAGLVNSDYLTWFDSLQYPETDDNWPDPDSDIDEMYDTLTLNAQESDVHLSTSLPLARANKSAKRRKSDLEDVVEEDEEEEDIFIPQSQIDLTPAWLSGAVREQLVYHKDVSEEDRELLATKKKEAEKRLENLERERAAWESRVAAQYVRIFLIQSLLTKRQMKVNTMTEAFEEIESRISCLSVSLQQKDMAHIDGLTNESSASPAPLSLKALENMSAPKSTCDVLMDGSAA